MNFKLHVPVLLDNTETLLVVNCFIKNKQKEIDRLNRRKLQTKGHKEGQESLQQRKQKVKQNRQVKQVNVGFGEAYPSAFKSIRKG
jgi:hypothetical protein